MLPIHPISLFLNARGLLMVPQPGCLLAFEEISGRVFIDLPIELWLARASLSAFQPFSFSAFAP